MATGDIGSVQASLEFEPTNISGTPGFIHISGDVYAIFYFQSSVSFIKTYTITDFGSITLVDSKQFAVRFGIIDVIYISGTIYAFVAQGNDGDGWLRTVSIANDGTIGTTVETLEFDTVNASYPKIINVSGTVYAITYTDIDSDGWLKTVNIDADGTNLSIIDTFEFENVKGFNPHMLNVSGTTYAIVYTDTNNDGQVKTITIENNGTIGSVLNTLKFEDDASNDAEIVKIDGDVYAIVYGKVASAGWVRTLTISDVGALALVDSYNFEAGNCDYPSIIYISESDAGNIIAVAYTGPAGDGWIKTVEIADNGTILSNVDSLEFDIVSASAMKLIAITGDIYAIAYVFTQGSDGWLKTVDIITAVPGLLGFSRGYIIG